MECVRHQCGLSATGVPSDTLTVHLFATGGEVSRLRRRPCSAVPNRVRMTGAVTGYRNDMTAASFIRRATAAWRRARARHGWLDHLSQAVARYAAADGGRLSAAVTYYAFFATFAMALVGFAIFGFVLDDPAVQRSVQHYLA